MTGIEKKNFGSNMDLKLYMAKAYDRVSWLFLIKVLQAFGFGECWIVMVWQIISSNWFSNIVNGSPVGFFRSSQGLR